ncbi:MAG: choloylglycine hydrolase family protein [Clostridiales bacterium]|nr:choloylglycine hydrolase family protein [Clostridiales bacterium]
MCTAVAYNDGNLYFGRTFDFTFSYGEEVTITPRNYPFVFQNGQEIREHFALIGIAHVEEHYPLYYDVVNEKGLGMAGLYFVGNAKYKEKQADKTNVASYELIPWILSQCATVEEAKQLLAAINITNDSFSETLPPAPLHWFLADCHESVTVEAVHDGVHVYDNPVGVLTNNPPFKEQLFGLNNYMHCSAKEPQNHFSDKLSLHAYSRGMGALGLPGDFSSSSRFVRASFVKMNAVSSHTEWGGVNQCFHILSAVSQPRGCCNMRDGEYEITLYTSCCDAKKGIYYYTTYENHQITAVDLHKESLDLTELVRYPLVNDEQIRWQNGSLKK